MDRSSSIAADTALDDPRVFRLYLAWFGPGLIKLGITAAERGIRRLLEQGAIAHTWLGEGPLAAARRAEATLGADLQIPDRITTAAKRAARTALSPAADYREELAATYTKATASTAWPNTLRRLPLNVADHTSAYALNTAHPPRPHAHIDGLAADRTVAGTLNCVVGADGYLTTTAGLLVLNLRLLSGWPLTKASPSQPTTAATQPVTRHQEVQHGLF